MSRHLICNECVQNYLPEGTRKIYERSKFGEPEEFQRLVLGIAKNPSQDQRFILINDERTDLSTDYYECDFCSKEIYPREKCGALSIWTELTQETPQWEEEYLTKVTDGVNRT